MIIFVFQSPPAAIQPAIIAPQLEMNHSGELKPRILMILKVLTFKWTKDLANLSQSFQ